MQRIKVWAKALKHEVHALIFAIQDPRTPVWVKVFAVLLVTYALSPVDLIPDFIPVLGLLDDLLIVPVGIYLIRKWIPTEVLEEARSRVTEQSKNIVSRTWRHAGLLMMVALWSMMLLGASWFFWRTFFG